MKKRSFVFLVFGFAFVLVAYLVLAGFLAEEIEVVDCNVHGDSGNDPFTFGYVTTDQMVHFETCNASGVLSEYTCVVKNGKNYTQRWEYDCWEEFAKLCIGGKCVQ